MAAGEETILYFAYGSNLLKERMQIRNPTAVMKCIGKLHDYCLEFYCVEGSTKKGWHGAAATVTEQPGGCVWGVVWRIPASQIVHLDRQEGIDQGIYKPIEVKVQTDQGEWLTCRAYYLLRRGHDKRPSPQYLEVIIQGAVQYGLPVQYVEQLKSVTHNGYVGEVDIKVDLPYGANKYVTVDRS